MNNQMFRKQLVGFSRLFIFMFCIESIVMHQMIKANERTTESTVCNFPMKDEEITYVKNNVCRLSKEYIFFLLIRVGDHQEYVEEMLGKPRFLFLWPGSNGEFKGYYIDMPPLKLWQSPIALGQVAITYDKNLRVTSKEFNGEKIFKKEVVVVQSVSSDLKSPDSDTDSGEITVVEASCGVRQRCLLCDGPM